MNFKKKTQKFYLRGAQLQEKNQKYLTLTILNLMAFLACELNVVASFQHNNQIISFVSALMQLLGGYNFYQAYVTYQRYQGKLTLYMLSHDEAVALPFDLIKEDIFILKVCHEGVLFSTQEEADNGINFMIAHKTFNYSDLSVHPQLKSYSFKYKLKNKSKKEWQEKQ